MQALVFRYNFFRFAFATILGKINPPAYLGPGSPLNLEEIPAPRLLADDWVIVRTQLCGICGSDVKQIFLDGNFDNPLTAFISFPQVLGHETVGVIEEVGPAVTNRRVGERVALNPWLPCATRGVDPPCPACQRGETYVCENFTGGNLPPGMHIGNNKDVSGGYAPFFAAHQSQLFPIPESIRFEEAVLADPFSVSLHAILKAPPEDGATAIVYGCGTLGLLSIAILRALYPRTAVIAITRYPHQEAMARQYGAAEIIHNRKPIEIIERVADISGAKRYQPWNGKAMLMGGVDRIYDTVGSPESIEVGIRAARPHARIVISGVANPARFEWTPLYFKEIELIGSNAFGVETFEGQRRHSMEIYLDLLAQNRFDLSQMVTHRFRLDQYKQAFLGAHIKQNSSAIKVVFDFTENQPV